MGTITDYVSGLASYIFISLATIINWESMKGDIAFVIGITLAIVRLYKYVGDIADRKAAKKVAQMAKQAKQNENNKQDNNTLHGDT